MRCWNTSRPCVPSWNNRGSAVARRWRNAGRGCSKSSAEAARHDARLRKIKNILAKTVSQHHSGSPLDRLLSRGERDQDFADDTEESPGAQQFSGCVRKMDWQPP